MKKLRNHTLVEFAAELAKKTPVPGGGSVAALSGALAAGLLAMVANYSVGRKIPAQDIAHYRKFSRAAKRFGIFFWP